MMSRSPLAYIVADPWLLSLVVAVLLCPCHILTAKVTLGITQWGDINSMFDVMQADDLPKYPCTNKDKKCVGGIPLLMGYIQDTRGHQLKDVNGYLSISTGNLVSGENGYLGIQGWKPYGDFLYEMRDAISTTHWYKPDVMSLGIKEFESGVEQTFNYLHRVNEPKPIPTLITNVNCDNQTKPSYEWQFCTNTGRVSYAVHTVRDDVKIGLVGFVNPLANKLADAGALTFDDPADAIARELAKKDLTQIKFVVAVGTGTYEMSKSIIDKSGGKVKLVIYGGGTKDLTGNYPSKYNDNSYIATIGAKYGTRLGWMKLSIDSDTGNFEMEGGDLREVVLIENSPIKMDPIAVTYFEKMKKENFPTDPVAKTRVKLDGATCWKQECNLGNLVTDSMVHCAHNYKNLRNFTADQLEQILKGPIISVWHGGALLKDDVEPGRQVLVLDVHTWLPYDNHAYLVKILGSTLRKLFDTSAEGLQDKPVPNWGQFLQVSSGIEVTYNDKKVSRIRTIHMNEDGVPRLKDIEDSKEYDVVIPSIMYKGKSVWDYMPSLLLNISVVNDIKLDIGVDDICLKTFLSTSDVISTGFDERIFLSDESGGGYCSKNNTGLTVFLTLLITALIFGSSFACWKFVIQPRRANNNCF